MSERVLSLHKGGELVVWHLDEGLAESAVSALRANNLVEPIPLDETVSKEAVLTDGFLSVISSGRSLRDICPEQWSVTGSIDQVKSAIKTPPFVELPSPSLPQSRPGRNTRP